MHPNWREKCGVFGVFAPDEDVARITFYGIYALQHRGQESAGIATGDGRGIHLRTGRHGLSKDERRPFIRSPPFRPCR